MSDLTKQVLLKEVGPRDGLQNEKHLLSTQDKVRLIESLMDAGHKYIEATAFVSPKAILQLADAEEVMKRVKKRRGVTLSALVPNAKGMERALACNIDEVAVFTAASETFNQKNINTSIKGSFQRFEDVFPLAQKAKIKVRGHVSTAFYCPYEGNVAVEQAAQVIHRLLEAGCYEVSVGDTIGRATPEDITRLFELLLKNVRPDQLAGHFHDTHGNALANVMAGCDLGITVFDSSVGGLGGCPYAPGAKGNVATETLVREFLRRGVDTGVSIEKLTEIADWIAKRIGAC